MKDFSYNPLKEASKSREDNITLIPNHYSATLSKLDLEMAAAIPPGGNWKNIPETVPSRRVEQIRRSYSNGGGSRSTYYGRLQPDKPSYTINTNFNRPGNGCHLHYDYAGGQNRVLSQREAARLQSFPDNFVFYGSKRSINSQIGNAVPPLLAYQIAKSLPVCGKFIDLFCGAGGLSLGFKWAGWKAIMANDIEPSFLETYRRNVHSVVVEGDIRKKSIFNEILNCISQEHRESINEPLIVLGGPPCQGFSTAGNRRSVDDERNALFYEYKKIIEKFSPYAFIFENVPGLTNMENGAVFEVVKSELRKTVQSLRTWTLHAEEYGIPQRRTRIFLIGLNSPVPFQRPKPITAMTGQPRLFGNTSSCITVCDALMDLPILHAGEDGSNKNYVCSPKHPYQQLMRSTLSPAAYIESLASFHS